MIRIKRVYDPSAPNDGFRILIDRLWPRRLSKKEAKVDLWLKEIAPSHELRKWYAHDPQKWTEFKQRYFKEIEVKKEEINILLKKAREGNFTLLFGAKNERYNNAAALKEYLGKKEKAKKGKFN